MQKRRGRSTEVLIEGHERDWRQCENIPVHNLKVYNVSLVEAMEVGEERWNEHERVITKGTLREEG